MVMTLRITYGYSPRGLCVFQNEMSARRGHGMCSTYISVRSNSNCLEFSSSISTRRFCEISRGTSALEMEHRAWCMIQFNEEKLEEEVMAV